MLRVDCNRTAIGGQCLIRALQRLERGSARMLRRGILRIDVQRLFQKLQGEGRVAALRRRQPDEIQRPGVPRLGAQDLRIQAMRLLKLAALMERNRFLKLGLQRHPNATRPPPCAASMRVLLLLELSLEFQLFLRHGILIALWIHPNQLVRRLLPSFQLAGHVEVVAMRTQRDVARQGF